MRNTKENSDGSKQSAIIIRVKVSSKKYRYVVSDYFQNLYTSNYLKDSEKFCKENNYDYIYSWKN